MKELARIQEVKTEEWEEGLEKELEMVNQDIEEIMEEEEKEEGEGEEGDFNDFTAEPLTSSGE